MNTAKIAFTQLREQIIDEHNQLDMPITMAQATVIAIAQLLDEDAWDETLLLGPDFTVAGVAIDGTRLLIEEQ